MSDRDLPAVVSAIIYLLLIVAAEGISQLLDQTAGAAVYAALFLSLIAHAAIFSEADRLLLPLLLIPLMRLLDASLPFNAFSPAIHAVAVTLCLLAPLVIIVRLTGLSWRDAGVTLHGWPVQIVVAIGGLLLGTLRIWSRPVETPWLIDAGLLLTTRIVEAYVFWGIIQRGAVDALGSLGGIGYVAVLYVTLHTGTVLEMGLAFLLALFFAIASNRTSSILGVAIGHSLSEFIFLLLPAIL